MEHIHASANWGAATFWLFIAIAAAASHWEKARRNAEKHETMRRIIEKTGTVDEARLKDLFRPGSPDWLTSRPGSGYRALRIAGCILMFIAAGVALFFVIMGRTGVIPDQASTIGLASSAIVALSGVGLFFASRFAEPPPDQSRNEPAAR